MEYYDAHIHFFYQCSFNELKHNFDHLEKAGFVGINVLVISEFPAEIDTYLKMIPGAYHPFVTREALVNQRDPFAVMNLPRHLKIVPLFRCSFYGASY